MFWFCLNNLYVFLLFFNFCLVDHRIFDLLEFFRDFSWSVGIFNDFVLDLRVFRLFYYFFFILIFLPPPPAPAAPPRSAAANSIFSLFSAAPASASAAAPLIPTLRRLRAAAPLRSASSTRAPPHAAAIPISAVAPPQPTKLRPHHLRTPVVHPTPWFRPPLRRLRRRAPPPCQT